MNFKQLQLALRRQTSPGTHPPASPPKDSSLPPHSLNTFPTKFIGHCLPGPVVATDRGKKENGKMERKEKEDALRLQL
jgi:hypothetical protein